MRKSLDCEGSSVLNAGPPTVFVFMYFHYYLYCVFGEVESLREFRL